MIEAVVQYFPQLLQGFLVTLSVAVGSFVLGLIFAVVLAPAAVYGSAPVRKVIAGYVSLIRGLPELLVIFLIFYGGTVLLTGLFGVYVEVDALTAGIAALTVVSTAYLTEIVRGALVGVSSGQWEAALALGLRRPGAFRLIVLPQMMVRALPRPRQSVARDPEGERLGLDRRTRGIDAQIRRRGRRNPQAPRLLPYGCGAVCAGDRRLDALHQCLQPAPDHSSAVVPCHWISFFLLSSPSRTASF